MLQFLLAEPVARMALIAIGAIIVIAIVLIVLVVVKVENTCGAKHEPMYGCSDGNLTQRERLAPHYGTYTRGPMAPYGALPLPRPPDSSFFRRNHWRGARWYGPPPSNYYLAHNWNWPGPTDIDAVYWDGNKYAPCGTCEKPEDCRDCPAAKRWFRGW